MKPVAERFSKNLREELQSSPYSQESIAEHAGLLPKELSRLAQGEEIPYLDTVVKLASALDVSVERLIEGIIWNPVASPEGSFEVTQDDGGR